jgi:hypothetical protein
MRSAVKPSSLPIFEGFSGRAAGQTVTIEFLARRDTRSRVVVSAFRAAAAVLALASGFLVARPLAVALQHGRLLGSHGTPLDGWGKRGKTGNFEARKIAQSSKSMPD